jgi:hypothetical protein
VRPLVKELARIDSIYADAANPLFAGALECTLWCNSPDCPGLHQETEDGVPRTLGRRIDPSPGVAYWIVKDIGPVPEGVFHYVADEWYACCEACADRITQSYDDRGTLT